MLVSSCLEGNTLETGYIHERSEWMCPERGLEMYGAWKALPFDGGTAFQAEAI